MTVMGTTAATPDYAAIKTKQNAAWASGDYARIGTTLQIVGENLAEAMDLSPVGKVLDVAAGNGTPRSPLHAAGAMSPRPTTWRRFSRRAAPGRKRKR